MDWDWYQTISVIALILSAGTAWELAKLRKHLHTEDFTRTRKWKRAISGPRYVPKHKPDKVSEYAKEHERRFYRDFAPVADLLNKWHEETPWSFENTGRLKTEPSEFGAEREIEIRYNQQKTGVIELSCSRYGGVSGHGVLDDILREQVGKVRAHLDLVNGRCFEGFDVLGLASSLADIVADTPEAKQDANSAMMVRMINAMWQVGEEAFGNPSLEFWVDGNAEWYLKEWLPKNAPPQD